MVADFTTLLSIIDRSSRQKISKNTWTPLPTHLIWLTFIRTFHSSTTEYTVFSRAQKTFAKRDCILGYKTSLDKLKRIQVIYSVFSDHEGIKMEINNRMISGQSPNIWKINNMLLHYPLVKEFQREIRKYFVLNENGNTAY